MAWFRRGPAWKVGTLLLAVWLILTGLVQVARIDFSGRDTVLAILAIAAGVLILLDR
jgi:hypothetical protein